MKARSRQVLTFCVFGAALGVFALARRTPSPDSGPDHAVPDNDYFYLQRRAADGRVNLQARREALEQARLLQAAAVDAEAAGVWELRGPLNVGGRVTDIAGDPGNPNVFYVGAASGGVWATTDGGARFTPIFDGHGSLSIGALAVDPRDARVLYVGTGEASPGGGSVAYPGDGVWKTTDGGQTWRHLGLEDTVHVGRIVVDPADPDTVFVAAMGNLFSTNPERGVYRSTDGGETWRRVLFVSDTTGAIDLAIDPREPRRVFAATWERIRFPNGRAYGGPGSGLWRSLDGGDTWTRLGGGLPDASTEPSRIGVAVSATAPNIVYAVYYLKGSQSLNGVFRSTDSGTTWERRPASGLSGFIGSQGSWSGRIFVNPRNASDVWVDGVGLGRSLDGAATFASVGGMHVDHHAQWFSPSNPGVILKGNDGGLYRSTNGGSSWMHFRNLPISQFYTVEVHPAEPFKVYGGLQDNGVKRTVTGGLDNWTSVVGGDGFEAHVDPRSTSVIYAESQFGNLRRSIDGGATFSGATAGVTGRRNWKMPLATDPFSTGTGLTSTLYLGSHQLFRSTNSATSWTAISGDLTDGDGGVGGTVFGTITAIALAPSNRNTIYAGTDDGNLWVTRDGGASYARLDAALPDLWVTRVAVDPASDAIAYVTFSGFRVDEPQPHVFRTTDHGATWTDASGNLPDAPVNDIVIDPRRASTLYVATDVGVFVSHDTGGSWAPLGSGLPAGVVVTDIKVIAGPPVTLYAATYGRSIHSLELPAPPGGTTVLDARFDAGAEGFAYADDVFRGTTQAGYASGQRIATGGFTGGALRVRLGGIDEADILNMSGGWGRSFDLARASRRTTLKLRVRVTQAADYEADERTQGLVSIDGRLVGVPPADFVAQVVGDGNGGAPRTSNWQMVTVELGALPSGSHRLVVGGFNNKKTTASESSDILIDDVLLAVEE